MGKVCKKEMSQLLRVYFIMGSNNCHQDPIEVVKQAISGGITLFQFREKGMDSLIGEEKILFAKELQKLCKQYHVPFIVNDDVELAIKLDADGVHIGQDDEQADVVRERIGTDKIVGVSTHTVEEVKKALADGADYVGIGPVFPTSTKEDAKGVQGTTLIEEIRKHDIDVPIVGIGGITEYNAPEVMRAGADGVSVITAISHAANPFECTKRLVEATSL
ncbi:thiamine phosphate synthase [Bacillus sp. CGMCC 1.16541]|uniref:thiamine phosphate synthase n=1 Tax=Bacillus sp. CGMCC 1.16541 TaxID=2185143 RepID=UPI000D73E7B4|nr:thiamine phosphate synthase [Bacillus sp. CGMCC 1.16541]